MDRKKVKRPKIRMRKTYQFIVFKRVFRKLPMNQYILILEATGSKSCRDSHRLIYATYLNLPEL